MFLLQRALGIGYEQDVIKYAKVVNETVGEIINIREKVGFCDCFDRKYYVIDVLDMNKMLSNMQKLLMKQLEKLLIFEKRLVFVIVLIENIIYVYWI